MQNVILKVIDAHLTLYGHFNRHEVVEVTGVGIASVSRAIKLYDGQCTYIAERKRYEANKDFKPVFPKLEHMRYLRVLATHWTQTGFPKWESVLWPLLVVFLLYLTNVFSSLVKPMISVIVMLFIMSAAAKMVPQNQNRK